MQNILGHRVSIAIDRTAAAAADDDHALVAAALRDREAFAPLYVRYAVPIYRYCYRRLGSREYAEDATSIVFEKALAALHTHRGGSFRGWLFTIAHNVSVTVGKERRHVPLVAVETVVDAAPSPEDLALAADDHRSLHALMDALSVDQRRVVELRLSGLTGAEIAQVLGKSVASIKMLQLRAMARLRRSLKAETDEQTPRVDR
jgi:RNA polymerase sigma-70 factor (ECF subfamily)